MEIGIVRVMSAKMVWHVLSNTTMNNTDCVEFLQLYDLVCVSLELWRVSTAETVNAANHYRAFGDASTVYGVYTNGGLSAVAESVHGESLGGSSGRAP